MVPTGPFSSVGHNSFIKPGTSTEKVPEASPKINLPMMIAGTFSINVSPAPKNTRKLL